MRIVFDLQCCQHPGIDTHTLHNTLALVQEMANTSAGRDLWIAFDRRDPARLDALAAAFAGAVPPERLVGYTGMPQDDEAGARLAALVRQNFFEALGADLVFVPGPWTLAAGTAAGATRPRYRQAFGPAAPASLAAARAGLRQADLLLVQHEGAAAAAAGADGPALVDVQGVDARAAAVAWAAFERLAPVPAHPAQEGVRARLAWVTASAPDGTAAALLAQLAPYYEIELVAPAGAAAHGLPLRTLAWFEEHGAAYQRVLYHFTDSPACAPLPRLLARHPGIVVLHDFALGQVFDGGAPAMADAAGDAFGAALFASHGYSGLQACQRLGRSATAAAFPLNRTVLEQALGVIVHDANACALARHWYGPHAAAGWRVVDLSGSAALAGDYADAIEHLSCRSPGASYRRLLQAVAAAGAPRDPRARSLIAAARAIAANQPPARTRQLLVDVSALAATDLKTGIQRVVRSILLALIKDPPPGFRIEPVYGDGGNQRYRYARRFALGLIGLDGVQAEDEVIEHQAGDVFLGLDLAANITVSNLALLADMRSQGMAVYFVVYDVLPLLQPEVFPFGTDQYFGEYIRAVAAHADGLLCISRAVADELADWVGAHAAPRTRPLKLAHFHLGADLDASAPTSGLPDDAPLVLAALGARPSILMVGTLEPRKCHAQALAAFELLWEQGVDVNLVIIGKQGWMVDALADRLRSHPRRGHTLFWLPGVSDEMLTEVYRLSSALLAASSGEGFGLPLIEAAQHGLPIIARALPVFREVSGEHAFYFEGKEPARLAEAVQHWLRLSAEGLAPASSAMPWLSWSASAQQVLDAIVREQWYRILPAAPHAQP